MNVNFYLLPLWEKADEGSLSAEKDPSSVALRAHLLPQGEKEERNSLILARISQGRKANLHGNMDCPAGNATGRAFTNSFFDPGQPC